MNNNNKNNNNTGNDHDETDIQLTDAVMTNLSIKTVCSHTFSAVFVALSSQQVTQQIAFYQSFFLVEPTVKTAHYGEFSLLGLKIAIFEPSSAHAAEFAQRFSGPMSFCIEVGDLDTAIAHLTTLGYPPPGDVIHASHGKEIYAYDPDGNRLILHQS